jgi:CRISPR-associated protein Cas1
LELSHGQLACEVEGERHVFPLEDMATIIVDTPQVTVTAALMAACAKMGVAMMFSNGKHIPAMLALPFHQHSKQTEVARRQLATSEPFRKRTWQRIVRSKISNQAACLSAFGRDGGGTLGEMTRHVTSGDEDNVEARAARFYWSKLFDDFRRESGSDRRNSALDYGYAVVRAAIARCLVGYGFLPCVGLHHDGVQNAFNLADDLLEPFRPFVDLVVARRAPTWEAPDELSKEDRQAMAGVLDRDCILDGDQVVLFRACELLAESLSTAVRNGDPTALKLPVLAADLGIDDPR